MNKIKILIIQFLLLITNQTVAQINSTKYSFYEAAVELDDNVYLDLLNENSNQKEYIIFCLISRDKFCTRIIIESNFETLSMKMINSKKNITYNLSNYEKRVMDSLMININITQDYVLLGDADKRRSEYYEIIINNKARFSLYCYGDLYNVLNKKDLSKITPAILVIDLVKEIVKKYTNNKIMALCKQR